MENKEPKYIGRVLDLAMKAGTMLLKSGAEVRRVEEVIVRIAGVFDVKVEKTCYSLTNGLFVSYTDEDGNSYAKVYQEEIGSSRFNHLIEVNQFSRDLAREKWTLDEAEKRLETIANKKDTSLI